MNKIKEFLEKLTEDGFYYAEVVDSLAELFIETESLAIALIEEVGEDLVINFRVDIPVRSAASITQDLTEIDPDIVIAESFMALEDKVLYGEDADAAFYSMIHDVFEEEMSIQSSKKNGPITYVVEQPLMTFGKGDKSERKRKMQRLWAEY